MSRNKTAATIRFEAMKTRISSKLSTDPRWVEAAILALYTRQTTDEQAGGVTRHDNSQGFTAADARRMSFVAEFLKGGKHLTREKALGTYSRRLQKYAGQLARIALAKQAAQGATQEPAQASGNRCTRCNTVRCPDGCCCAC